MRARTKIAIAGCGTVLLFVAAFIFIAVRDHFADERMTEERSRMLERLRAGPFDDELDARKIIADFREPLRASAYYKGKYLRVRGRFREVFVDRDGQVAVLAFGGHDKLDRDEENTPLMCVYIGDFHLAHVFSRDDLISLHAYQAGAAGDLVLLLNCVIEPP